MTDNNSMEKLEYVLDNVLYSFVAMLWYRGLLFIPLDNCTARTSKIILWGLIAIMVSIGVIITFKNRRNYLSLVVNILSPFEIYAVVSYWNYLNAWVKTTVIVACTIAFLFFSIVVFQKISSKRVSKTTILMKRIKHALLGGRTIIAICLCSFIIPLGVNSFIGRDLFQASDGDTIVLSEYDEWTISNNMETILKIKPENWEKASIQERIEILSVIKNIEARYLGINHEIYLSADSLSEGTLGCYFSKDRKIVIDIQHLKNSPVEAVVHTLAHECHHVYTRQQVELYKKLPAEYKNMLMFDDVKVYAVEYADYIDGNEDFLGYAMQSCEIDAEIYADEAVEDYYNAILKYENKKDSAVLSTVE